MTFDESVAYLSNLHAFGWRLDLSRMAALCERLGHPERAFKVVHVAGTNGKGSTTAMIAAILAQAGYRTGAYFSPYVFNLRERVMLAEAGEGPRMIAEEDFARLMTALRPHVEAVAQDESLGQPTEFETKTMLAFLYFREKAVDWVVLETGLGGRLDATNVVQPEAAVITNVGLDHTDRLGNTIEEIAGEKAGIVKPSAAVVTGASEPALSVVRAAWAARGASEWAVTVPPCGEDDPWNGFIEANRLTETVMLTATPSSPAAYQRANAALAELTARVLQRRGIAIPDEAITSGIASASLPGRFQIIRENPTVILDGAHNTEGAHELATSLRARYPNRPITLVIGMMGRHSVEGVVSELASLAKRIVATQPSDDRHLPARKVAEQAAAHGFEAPVVTPPMEALRTTLADATPDSVIVVTGSFYTVGEIDVDAVGSS
jgi:dihydrofolate synthase/folylpolyglutamate synthase